jgi:hypothetical protein
VNDVIFIVIALAFFALAALYVKFCDSIVGSDNTADEVLEQPALDESVAA